MTDLINETKKALRSGFYRLKVVLMYALLVLSHPAFSQTLTVNGKVTDAQTGEVMIGLHVVINGTVRGAVTDMDGNYTMTNCPSDAILVFTYVGYEQLEIPVQGRTVVDAAINSSSSVLEEIIVIGYGTARKKDVTGSISSVQGKDLARIPVSTAVEALTGKMAGVQVVTTERVSQVVHSPHM